MAAKKQEQRHGDGERLDRPNGRVWMSDDRSDLVGSDGGQREQATARSGASAHRTSGREATDGGPRSQRSVAEARGGPMTAEPAALGFGSGQDGWCSGHVAPRRARVWSGIPGRWSGAGRAVPGTGCGDGPGTVTHSHSLAVDPLPQEGKGGRRLRREGEGVHRPLAELVGYRCQEVDRGVGGEPPSSAECDRRARSPVTARSGVPGRSPE